MKAIVYERYGSPDVLELKEVEKPVPKKNEVLIKTHAASLNSYDWRLMRADPFMIRLMGKGLFKPKNGVLGADVSGRVEAVGADVRLFRVGDDVYGDLASWNNGGYAEYVCAGETVLALKPANISYEEAAAVPMAALTALQGLRDAGRILPGQKVLINGASGGVGTFAVLIAKAFGAEVTAVCSTQHLETARRIGADYALDYTREDFTKNGQRYDLILGANGNRSIFDYARALCPGGTYVMTGGSMPQVFQAMLLGPWISKFGSKKMLHSSTKTNPKDLIFLKEWIETGKITPVVDRRFPLSETKEAFRYFEDGHARGKVVISVADSR